MDFKTYQQEACKTVIYPKINKGWEYPALGLAGEVGELMNKLKKIHRDDREFSVEEATGELGDVLWYTAMLATELGVDLKEVAQKNIDKLNKRQKENKLQGSGDNR